MHSTELPTGGTVPAFLTKLWRLVEDPDCNELICWSSNGVSFFIHDQTRFAKELLPMYFKHNNMASFIRQLNMYGFRKMVHVEQGGLKSENDTMEFYHQYFLKGQEQLLEFIKRKVPVPAQHSRVVEDTQVKTDVMQEILTDVKAIRGKQENVDSLLNSMKRENEALWREVAFLRQKHLKQQQVVEKLIQFLVTLVQPGNRNINVPVVQRKLPLMLYDSSINKGTLGTTDKIRITRQFSSPAGSSKNITSSRPVIHDVTDSLDGKLLNANTCSGESSIPSSNLLEPATPSEPQVTSPLNDHPLINSPSVGSPLNPDDTMEPLSVLVPLQTPTNSILMSDEQALENEFLNSPVPINLNDLVSTATSGVDLGIDLTKETDSALSLETVENASLNEDPDAQPSTSGITKNSERALATIGETSPYSINLLSPGYKTRFDLERSTFSDHLEGIDSELDWLTEQLSGNSLNIDTSNLLSLFGADDTVPGNNLSMDGFRFSRGGDVTGNEVVQYLPGLLDTDLIDKDTNYMSNDLEGDDSEFVLPDVSIKEFLEATQKEFTSKDPTDSNETVQSTKEGGKISKTSEISPKSVGKLARVKSTQQLDSPSPKRKRPN